MANYNWIDYTSLAISVVGMITGVVGARLGYISYRRSNEIKSLDLRLELRREVSTTRKLVELVVTRINQSKRSRRALAAMAGNSGAALAWQGIADNEIETANNLGAALPSAEEKFTKLTQSELENKLVESHQIAVELNALLKKYGSAISSDDAERHNLIRLDRKSTRLNSSH